MFIKKFEAPSLEKALQLVKMELGPNALILSTNRRKDSWFKKSVVEVTAAMEREAKAATKEGAEKATGGLDAQSLAEVFPHRKRQLSDSVAKPRYVEIEGAPSKPTKPTSARFEEVFLKAGLLPSSARELSQRLAHDYPKTDLQVPSFVEKARTRLLASGIKTMSPADIAAKASWVAIGTAGSGKTSVLVKLALKLKGDKVPVALVSCDERKIVGRTEMSAYAKLIRVPFETDVRGERSQRIELIDSPAFSPDGEEDDAIEKLVQDRASVLVLDASMRFNELKRIIDYAGKFSPRALAFTRLDVVAQRGILYDTLRYAKLPLLGMSVSHSFKIPFKSVTPTELGQFILSKRTS